jgi:uncharacterized protein YndB with AHSA1/START domain
MITSGIFIKAPTNKIWQAITDKNQMKGWYFDISDFELNSGSTFNFFESGGKNEYHHRCIIHEVVPNKKFSHTWTHPSHSKGESTVTWLLNETRNGTEVTLTHDGLENFADAGLAFAPENYQMGWDGLMVMLKNFIYGLRKRKFDIEINASANRVWECLLNHDTYRQWTNAFCEGSYYKGELKQGGRIHFLTPAGSGMYSNVIFYMPNKSVLFQHIGEIKNFEEQPVDEETEKWSGSFEQYTLTENKNKIILEAKVDLSPEHFGYFDQAFPKALLKLKEIAENIVN